MLNDLCWIIYHRIDWIAALVLFLLFFVPLMDRYGDRVIITIAYLFRDRRRHK